MSNPSLILPQSPAYGEDYVYAAQVEDGAVPLYNVLPLTFTRASGGTRINKDGVVQNMPYNLATYSENFSANYIDINSTISSNTTTAPNGTTTAESILETTATDVHAIRGDYTETSGIAYTYSVYAKTISGRNIQVLGSNGFTGPIARVNLSNGTLLSGSTGASVESVGNGWYRISITETTTTTSIRVIIYSMDGTATTFAGSTSNGIYIWGAQLNIGSTAQPYLATTDRLNMPRITYPVGGGCGALLLEKQSTNLVSYSNGFDDAYWDKTNQGVGSVAVITPNYTTSPDGTNNAFRFQCNLNGGTTTNDRSWMVGIFTAQATSTMSIYIKLNSAGTKTIVFSDGGGNLKTISNTEWQRIDGTYSGASGQFRIGLIGGLGTSDTLDCSIAFAQAEGGSYATSYIPTTSTSATRIADACVKTGISNLIGQTSGSVFLDFTVDTISGQTNDPVLWYMKDGGIGERYVELFSNGNLLYIEYDGSAVIASITKTGLTVGRHKCAIAYAPNDMTFYVDGVQIGTDTSGTPSGLSTFGFQYYNSAFNGQQRVNNVQIFQTRLTNAELASLTTL